jgi:hypothetical protein
MASRRSPLGALLLGLAAGAAGNAVFTGYQALKARWSGGGESASEEPPPSWEEAPTPARVGRWFVQGVFDRRVSRAQAPALTRVVHWAYGTSWGGVYGLVHETFHRPAVADGLALGTLVTAADYTALPLMRLYKPPWEYPAKTLAGDLADHAVYGLAVAGAYRLFERVG